MENKFMNSLKKETNFGLTENCAVKHLSTLNKTLDLFSMGGAFRNRSQEDCIALFKSAYDEDPVHALRCLFYLRDARGGQGERRFFRVVIRWLASYDAEAVVRNLEWIPFFGRFDDLFALVDTPVEKDVFRMIKSQLVNDLQEKHPSLLVKWLPSENTSSKETRAMATRIRKELNMTPRQYRKTLSLLRERIKVVEKLMSQNRWDEIDFSAVPSYAGLRYKNAFARNPITEEK